ncbi:MAG: hypothetical protein K1X81_10285 [Bacteroidia bacterium]|nr:hypothetical protein [Bacteroidia bacterium]
MNSVFKVALFYFIPSLTVNGMQTQNDSAESKNAIYAEMFGNGFFYSLNYDRCIVKLNTGLKINGRFGVSYYDTELWQAPFTVLNASSEINCLWGRKEHFFETGFGYSRSLNVPKYKPYTLIDFASIQLDINDNLIIFSNFNLRIGYRFQRNPDGLLLRIAFTPMFARTGYYSPIKYSLIPWGGICIGHAF